MAFIAAWNSLKYLEASLGGVAVATAYPPAQQGLGTLLYDSTASVFYKTVITGGVLAWALVGGAGSAPTPVTSHDYYVSSVGSDSNPGTSGSPFLTIEKAIETIALTPWRTFAHITIQNTITMASQAYLRFPKPLIPGAENVLMLGTWSTSAIQTATGGTQGAMAGTAGTVTVGTVTGGLIPLTGGRLRWVTGGNAGLSYWSATGAGPMHTAMAAAPVNGDTYYSETPLAQIVWSGSLTIEGPVTIADGIDIAGTTGRVAFVGDVAFSAVWIRSTNADVAVAPGAVVYFDASAVTRHSGVTIPALGAWLSSNTIEVAGSGFGYFGNCLFDITPINGLLGCRVECESSYAFGASVVTITGGNLSLNRHYASAVVSSAGSAAVVLLDGSSVKTTETAILGTTLGSGMILDSNSSGILTKLVGTANGEYGLRVKKGGIAHVASPDVNATITGTSGAVLVGGNAVCTWANIAGGTSAFCNDLAAGVQQLCFVGA